MNERNKRLGSANWYLNILATIVVGIFAYGVIIAGWFALPEKIETIESGVNELLGQQSRRIFTIVPEKREVRSSRNPRLFEVEIPPNAVEEPVRFEFDQMPVMSLPAALDREYEFLGWSAVLGSDTSELMKALSAKVELMPEETAIRDQLSLFRWSPLEAKWIYVPTEIMQDRLTGRYLLDFETKELGLYALTQKVIEEQAVKRKH